MLGAAAGEAAAGRRLGRRALVWGALAGTLPDLDVLASPFLTDPEALRFHRGVTHSLFFAFVAAPLLAWLTARLHRRFGWGGEAAGEVRPWLGLWFWGLWTHPMLDAFTVYGTQLLWPVSRHPFAVSSVFIIDLFYTVPLLVACVVAWRARADAARRRRAVVWGLALSSLYLAWGVGVQRYVQGVAETSLRASADAPARRLLVAPSGPSSFLWTATAEMAGDSVRTPASSGPAFRVGTLSLFDERPHRIAFQTLRGEQDRVAAMQGEGIDAVRWFSLGWFTARPAPGDSVDVCDLRFGRTDGYATRGDAPCVFTFRLPAGGETFRQAQPDLDARAALGTLWRRTLGTPPAWAADPDL